MITGILLILIVLCSVYWFVLYPNQKIKQLKDSVVLQVDGAEKRYLNLPLGTLGIFSQVNDNHRVQVILPKLTAEGDVEYIYSWHGIQSISVPTPTREKPSENLKLRAAKELAWLIKEHLRLEPELLNLREQHQQIDQLLHLVTTSDLYANQQDVYERALLQVENLLGKAEELQQVYIRFIREALIGNQLAAFNPDLLPNNSVAIDNQYKSIKQEYENMKETATAYTELIRIRQV